MRMLKEHNRLQRQVFSRFNGKEVKTMGDAFLLEFDSALEATECSIEMQKVFHQRNRQRKEKLLVRVGIHVGDVIHRKGDVFGDAVNIDSRIEPLAEGGNICISEQVYAQVRNKISFPLIRLESPDLKNIAFPIAVYKVRLPWTRRKRRPEKGLSPSLVSLIKRNQIEEEKVDRRSIRKFILKSTMKDRLTIVKLINDPEIPETLAWFSETVDYGRGETLHIVSAVETVSIVIDSANLERLVQMVPKKNILRVYPGLAEIGALLS